EVPLVPGSSLTSSCTGAVNYRTVTQYQKPGQGTGMCLPWACAASPAPKRRHSHAMAAMRSCSRLAEAGAAIGPCEPGEAMATPAFDLDPPVRHIIHTVGPIWEGGGYGEARPSPRVIGAASRPLTQSGPEVSRFLPSPRASMGFPPDQAAKIAVETIRSTPTAVERVRLIAFDESARDVLNAALRQ
ncbi:MAG TPA: macro domain-containing protein, partial [Streptosporangiaceae bacterium]|nr:macro domain-containing protein [Streptosporangiaceae bacterium]